MGKINGNVLLIAVLVVSAVLMAKFFSAGVSQLIGALFDQALKTVSGK